MIDFDEITMPMIAIGGGFVLLFALLCIGMWRRRVVARRRRALLDARRTSFHVAVIDPTIADQHRAAWERPAWELPAGESAPQMHEVPVEDDQMIEVVNIPLPEPSPLPVEEHTTIGYAPRPPTPRGEMMYARRFARGSVPAIPPTIASPRIAPTAAPAHGTLPAQPLDWDARATPSVTARMRAHRRG